MSGEDCESYKRDMRCAGMPKGCISCKHHNGFSCTARKRGRDVGGHYVTDGGKVVVWSDDL